MAGRHEHLIVFDNCCTKCGKHLEQVPRMGETWILKGGVTLRQSEFEPKREQSKCVFDCPCHQNVVGESKSKAVDVIINNYGTHQACLLCECDYGGPESLKTDTIYDLADGSRMCLQVQGHIAMILGADSEFFDRKAKPSKFNRLNNKQAWEEDEAKGTTHKEQVKVDMGKMQTALTEAQEIHVVQPPLPNKVFPYMCPPAINSAPQPKPNQLPWSKRPKNEAERRKRLQDHFAPSLGALQESEKAKILNVVDENYDRFYYPGDVLPCIKGVHMDIQLMPGTPPIRQRPRPVIHAMREKVDEAIKSLIVQGAVSPCTSPWSSPLYPVWKKNGGVRLTVDYRQLNMVTIDEQFPLPRCFDLVTDLGSTKPKYFSTFDMTSGFYQVPMTENAKQLSAWSTFTGQYCFNRAAMGLKNSPMVFQRTMERVLRDVDPEKNRIRWYVDDILVVSETIDEHVELLEKLFTRMREVNLTCESSKCDLAKSEVCYLGYQIGRKGLAKGNLKVKAVEEYQRPRGLKELRSFLGLCSFFRRFVKGYASKTGELYNLTKIGVTWNWTEKCEQQFQDLKRMIVEDITLAYPDFNNPNGFIVQTDGSYSGLGGMLAQKDEEGRIRPIAFTSRALRGAEVRYTVSEIEALALVYCLNEFRSYILGYPVCAFTDHSALVSLLKQPSNNARIHRWSLILAEYNPTIVYKKGSENTVADFLSRQYEGLEKGGETFTELADSVRSMQTVEGRSSHPDAQLDKLIDNPQYQQFEQNPTRLGEYKDGAGKVTSTWNTEEDVWASISELQPYDLNEEVQPNRELQGVDIDVGGIFRMVASGTSSRVEYDTTMMGYYESEQEEIAILKHQIEEALESGYGTAASDVELDDTEAVDADVVQPVSIMAMYTRAQSRAQQANTESQTGASVDLPGPSAVKSKPATVVVNLDPNLEVEKSEPDLPETQPPAEPDLPETQPPTEQAYGQQATNPFEVADQLDQPADQLRGPNNAEIQTIEEFEERAISREVEQLRKVAVGQEEDPNLGAIIKKITEGDQAAVLQDREWSNFYRTNRPHLAVSKQKILYIRPDKRLGWRVFVPEAVIPFMLCDAHNEMGHPSIERMMGALERYVFWRKMRNSIKSHVHRCMVCASRQGQGRLHKMPMALRSIEPVPFANIYADVVSIGKSREGYKYVLTVVDSFSKWVECYPMYTQEAYETTKCMYSYLNRWDNVKTLLTDNGANFTSGTFEQMLKDKNCKHLYCSPFFPQGDGLSERTHRTVLNMLAKTCEKSRLDWCARLPEVVMWHNKMPNASTGVAPFTLVHNFAPAIMPSSPYMQVATFAGFTEDEKLELKTVNQVFDDAVQSAVRNLEAAHLLRKSYYDNRHKAVQKLVLGQRVFRYYPPAKTGVAYKLTRYYRGPYRLVKLDVSGAALIKRPDKVDAPAERVNVSHLTHCFPEVPTNRFWDGKNNILFKPNELSQADIVQDIKPEWLVAKANQFRAKEGVDTPPETEPMEERDWEELPDSEPVVIVSNISLLRGDRY